MTRFAPLFILLGLALVVAFVYVAAESHGQRGGDAPYAVDRDPFPTIQADTIRPGHVVGFVPGKTGSVFPVAVRSAEMVGDYVVLEHFDPRGCAIGVHGGECVIRTALRPEERVPLFPAESG